MAKMCIFAIYERKFLREAEVLSAMTCSAETY